MNIYEMVVAFWVNFNNFLANLEFEGKTIIIKVWDWAENRYRALI